MSASKQAGRAEQCTCIQDGPCPVHDIPTVASKGTPAITVTHDAPPAAGGTYWCCSADFGQHEPTCPNATVPSAPGSAEQYLAKLQAEQGTVSPEATMLCLLMQDLRAGLAARGSIEPIERDIGRLQIVLEGYAAPIRVKLQERERIVEISVKLNQELEAKLADAEAELQGALTLDKAYVSANNERIA